MSHPSYLGWQVDWPLFVKVPFGDWKKGQHYDWRKHNIDPSRVAINYVTGLVYHNTDLEVETKVGDRLNEMNTLQLDRLVTLLNAEVKSRTNSVTEYTAKKCKQSKIDDKQRGLLRSFLRNNRWIEDKFYEIRDNVLDAPKADSPQE